MLLEDEGLEGVKEKLLSVEKGVRVDKDKGRRAYTLAEPDAGVGLAHGDLLGVLGQLLGSDTPLVELTVSARESVKDFRQADNLLFDDFMRVYETFVMRERTRRKWGLLQERMASKEALSQRLKQAFALVEDQGVMPAQDVQPALRAVGLRLDNEELGKLLGAIEEPVRLLGFERACAKVLEDPEMERRYREDVELRAQETRGELEAIFAMLDFEGPGDGLGQISVADVVQGFVDCGWDMKEVQQAMKEFRSSSGDTICMEEALDVLILSRVSKPPVLRSA